MEERVNELLPLAAKIAREFANIPGLPHAEIEIVAQDQQVSRHHFLLEACPPLAWNVGEYISRKIQGAGWGKGTVQALSVFVQKMQPGIRGFSPQNIWRMR